MGISSYKRQLKFGGKVKLFAKKQLPVYGYVVVHVIHLQVVWQTSCQVWYVYNHKQVYSTHYESEFMIKMLPLKNDMAHITQLA